MPTITTSIRLNLTGVSAELDTLIHTRLMRPQQAACRVAYNRLIEGWAEKDVWGALRTIFPLLTGRNLNDAISMAKGILASQRERLPEQLQRIENLLPRVADRFEHLRSARNPDEERIQAIQRRIERLTQRRDALQAHLTAGTVPPALFGGRKLWRKVSRGLPEARQDWRMRRAEQYFSRGAANNRGNPHCRIADVDGVLCLAIRIPTETAQRGQRQTTRAAWHTCAIQFSRSYEGLLRQAAHEGAGGRSAYTVRLIRLEPCRYRAYITIEESVPGHACGAWEVLPAGCERIAGIDLNLDHVAVSITDHQGQFRGWRQFKFPNLGELPRDKSRWQIGNLAREVMEWLREQGVRALVVEDLNIRTGGGETARHNRRTVPFSYRQLAETLARRALREGLAVKRVNPAYTSWIGGLKYAPMYGISTHIAAAYVIARRGLGLQERLPTGLVRCFPEIQRLLQDEISQQREKPKDDQNKHLNKLREWLQRIENWKQYTPEAGRPWLLWVTLHGVCSDISEARSVLTYGRK